MFADAGDEVLLVENRLTLDIVELQITVDLATAFDELLAEPHGASRAPIEGRLKAVADTIDEVYGTYRVADDGNALHVAFGFLMKGNCACRKDTPVHAVRQALPGRKREARMRSGQLRHILW